MSNRIHDIYFSNNNEIWLGTWGNGLIRFNFNKKSKVLNSKNYGIPDNEIYMISEDSKSDLWIFTFGGGICRLKNNELQIFNKSNSDLGHNFIYNFHIDSQDNIWAGTWGDGLNYFNGKKWKKISDFDKKIPYKVPSVLVVNDKIYIGSIDGLFLKEKNKLKEFSLANSQLFKDSIYKLLKGRNNEIWLGYKTRGIAWYNGKTWKYFEQSKQLSSYDLALDSKDNLWIAAYGTGLAKFDGNTWTIFTPENSPVSDEYIFCAEVDKNDNVWAGTSQKGIVIYNENGINLDN